ncbi:MAG: hypothetical protein E7335_10980 [Clostridiales bacterium]|nr:hypothetical protein [Clostridiales bacterium]
MSSERGTLNYQLRDDGYYNLIFNNMQYCRSFFEDDYAGTSYTRYVMVDGVLTIDAQWHVPYWTE